MDRPPKSCLLGIALSDAKTSKMFALVEHKMATIPEKTLLRKLDHQLAAVLPTVEHAHNARILLDAHLLDIFADFQLVLCDKTPQLRQGGAHVCRMIATDESLYLDPAHQNHLVVLDCHHRRIALVAVVARDASAERDVGKILHLLQHRLQY